MLRDIAKKYYYSSELKKCLIRSTIGIANVFIFIYFLSIDYIAIPLSLIICFSIDLLVLILIPEEVMANESQTKEKIRKEKIQLIISIVFLILFYIFMRNFY